MARLRAELITPYHGFAILCGVAFASSLLWPEGEPTAALGAFMRGPFFPQAVAFLLGILALQVGEVERGYGAYPPLRRVGRLAGYVGLGLALVVPFLLLHRVEAVLPWPAVGGAVGFLLPYGVFWSIVGYGVAGAVHFPGFRFALKYGSYLAGFFLPRSPLSPAGYLFEQGGAAGWGALVYGALSLGTLAVWIWTARRFSSA